MESSMRQYMSLRVIRKDTWPFWLVIKFSEILFSLWTAAYLLVQIFLPRKNFYHTKKVYVSIMILKSCVKNKERSIPYDYMGDFRRFREEKCHCKMYSILNELTKISVTLIISMPRLYGKLLSVRQWETTMIFIWRLVNWYLPMSLKQTWNILI